jgi:hypothetical protein
MMALADAAINEDEYLTRYFDRLNNISPPLDLTSPMKPTARQPKEGWTMFTTYVADTRDKLVQIWKKADMNWPPTPLRVAAPARAVARPSQPAAPVAPTTRTTRLDPKGTTVFQFFVVDPETARNPMGDDSDDDGESTSPPTDMYAWRDTKNIQWLESVRNDEVTSLWVLVEKVLRKVPPQREIRVMYGATCNLSSSDKFPTIFSDPGLSEGGMQNISDDDQLKAWMAMTAHLNRPLGVGVYLRRQLDYNIPDSPTQGLMPHLDQQLLLHQAHPDAEEYPYDSEAYEVISKSRKRVGKPRTIEGYIRGMNRYGRRIRHSKWMLRKFRAWADGVNYRGGVSMADHICFPTEACWRPRMNVNQHIQEKTRYIAMGRNNAAYRAFVADPANAAIFANPPFPREVASDEEHST